MLNSFIIKSVCFAVIVSMLFGCAYQGTVPPISLNAVSSTKKVDATVYYKKGSGKLRPIQIAQGPTTYHIDVSDAIDSSVIDLLSSNFSNVNTTNPDDAALIAESAFVPTLKHLDDHGNAFIEARLQLQISDAKTGNQLELFDVDDSISYTPPVSATILQWLTGLSLFVLAPITIPAMVQAAGNKAVELASLKVPEMVSRIDSELVVKKKRIADYVAYSPESGEPIEKTIPIITSKYDGLLDCVVVIRTRDGIGTGFFINNNGYILTNEHVVRGEVQPSVKTRDGRAILGKVIAVDKDLDLALVQTGVNGSPWLAMADKSEIDIGSDVIAIGTPEGLDWSISKGIVSAVRQSGNSVLIQTDTPINHGNSGGPLISVTNGKVVGINAFGIKKSVAEGLNFAVSSLDAKRLFANHIKQ